MEHFYTIVQNLSNPVDVIYKTEYQQNDFLYNGDVVLKYLTKFFNYPIPNFKASLELSFEYCRKRPEHLPELIKRINEIIRFRAEDKHSGFFRQVEMFKIFVDKIKANDKLYIISFFAIAKSFLDYTYQVTESGRKMTISWYQYPVPLSEEIKSIRTDIYGTLSLLFGQHKKEVADVLIYHLKHHRTIIKTMYWNTMCR